ncbi:MAG: MATE family efflux transporter, partial [Bacteroidales bacterium]|nr:MATE family efflux transporter [Bacteroidales bacterium]
MEKEMTRGVRTLLGDPKKAVIKLSGPMMIAMLVQSLYNIVDGIWVAGLGSDALAAIGLFFPLFMIILSLANGLGVGGSSAISRKIGAHDRNMADSAAIHTLILGLLTGLLITVSAFPFLEQLFVAIGARGNVIPLVVKYSRVLVGGSLLLVFSNIVSGILRGEGDMKRTMWAMVTGSVLNIVLDPLFIYVLKMGIAGAAWATLVSITITSGLMFSWLFIKKNTYVSFHFSDFRFNGQIIREILRVGIPASFAQLSMALAMFFLNMIIVKIAGSTGIAVFTSAWRIMMIGIVPLVGIAIGVTAVTGASYGARDIDKLNTAYLYAIKIGIFIELGVVVFIFLLAPQISWLFTYSKNASHLAPAMTQAMRWLVWFLPGVPFGMLTSSMFQGIGQGEKALAITFLRTIIFQLFFSYLFGISLHFGIVGVWAGIITGNLTASAIGFTWGRRT